MILSAHQPAFLPWLGYFEKIARADIFIYLDAVQFEKNSFINRNQIKTPQGKTWLTIPVRSKGHTQVTMVDLLMDDKPWRKKILKTIEMNYRKAPFFEERFSRLEEVIQLDTQYLAEYCYQQLLFWMKELDIDTKIVRSSELAIDSKKSDLVLDLCKHFGASHYLSGTLGRDYLQEEDFSRSGISIEYQDYQPKSYMQLWGGEFIPYLSIVDSWLNLEKVPY